MEIIILDGKCMRDFESAHDYLSRVLRLPEYYGRRKSTCIYVKYSLPAAKGNVFRNNDIIVLNSDKLWCGF